MTTRHLFQYPAFRKSGETIINELCSCGALKTEHNPTLALGHGSCDRTNCRKFTWDKFISTNDDGYSVVLDMLLAADDSFIDALMDRLKTVDTKLHRRLEIDLSERSDT